MSTLEMAKKVNAVRIVVGSPGDTVQERRMVGEVVNELNRGLIQDREVIFHVSQWEKDAFPGFSSGGPQELIDAVLKIPECDIFIGILWKRFGTPTGGMKSGTEKEYVDALAAWRAKRRPHILFYFNMAPVSPKSSDELDQMRLVLEFRQQFPKEGFWWPYKKPAQFRDLLRDHLQNWLRNELSGESAAVHLVPEPKSTQAKPKPSNHASAPAARTPVPPLSLCQPEATTERPAKPGSGDVSAPIPADHAFLKGLRLREFQSGDVLSASHLAAMCVCIRGLEANFDVAPTVLMAPASGMELKAAHLNSIGDAISRLRLLIGLEEIGLEVRPSQCLAAEDVGKLARGLNEVLDLWDRRPSINHPQRRTT